MAGDTGTGQGKGFLSRFGIGRSSSRSQSNGGDGQAGPGRAARSRESDASGYLTVMPTRAGRSPTPGTGPLGAAPSRSTTTRMSVQMPTKDQFGILDHLLELFRIPRYVDLLDDTSRSEAAVVVAAAGTRIWPLGE
jgi:hypothetical protein